MKIALTAPIRLQKRTITVIFLLCIFIIFYFCYTRPLLPFDFLQGRELEKITLTQMILTPGVAGGSQTQAVSTMDQAEMNQILAVLQDRPVHKKIPWRRLLGMGYPGSTTTDTVLWVSLYYMEDGVGSGIFIYDVSSTGDMQLRPWQAANNPCRVGVIGNWGNLDFYEAFSALFLEKKESSLWQLEGLQH